MTLTQSDFRTVRVRQDSVDFFVRYSLIWNGEERLPESISAHKDHVTAYFLTATIRDSFTLDGGCLLLERFWEVLPAGELLPGFCFDFPGWIGSPYLLPGAAAGEYVDQEPVTCPGQLTAYPAAVLLFSEPHSLLLFSDLPASEQQFGRIELERHQEPEEEPCLRLRLLFPWQPRAGRLLPIASPGAFRGGLRLRLVTAPADNIYFAGLAAALGEREPLVPTPAAERRPGPDIPGALESCLTAHLTEQDGLVGLRARPGGAWLSMSAGADMALLLARLYPRRPDRIELARALADTVLSAQHPGGLFYERYGLKERCWQAPDRSGVLPVSCSLRIAASLLRLAARLETGGAKYELAALRAVDLFLDHQRRLAYPGSRFSLDTLTPRERGDEVLELAEPLALLYHRTRRDHYRKALIHLQQRFLADPPALAPPAASSAAVALRLARAAATLQQSGLRVRSLPAYLAQLLPWIYLNRPGPEEAAGLAGGILEGSEKVRLAFRGREWAHTLRSLAALLPPAHRPPELERLGALLPAAGGGRPLGCAGWQAEAGDGPVDARLLCREAWFALELAEAGQAS